MKNYFISFLALCFLSACGNNSTEVKALPPATQKGIDQNLQNGMIPTPEQVRSGNIPVAEDECKSLKAEIPKDWFQERLEVPENAAEPEGRKIKVFYYGKIYPGSIPTIVFNGGPAGASYSTFRALTKEKATKDSGNKLSFVYIDQRGTGCSDFYPQMKDNDKPDIETLKRLANYGSSGIVADSEQVHAKIYNGKKWNVFGQSYGAHIVHRYVMNSPEMVNAALAHANSLQKDGFERIKNRLASQVRVYQDYLKQFPQDEAALNILAAYMKEDKCYHSEDGREEICGAEVTSVFSSLIGFHTSWERMHKWIGNIIVQNQVLEENVNLFLAAFYYGDNTNPLNSIRWFDKVISWTDRNSAGLSVYNCLRAKDQLKAESNIDIETVVIGECASQLQYAKNHDTKKVEPEPSAGTLLVRTLPQDIMTAEVFAEKLKEFPQLPFYLYSGEKDPYVPVANFQEELGFVKDLPNLHYTNFPNSGHDGFKSEPQVWKDLMDNSVEVQ